MKKKKEKDILVDLKLTFASASLINAFTPNFKCLKE